MSKTKSILVTGSSGFVGKYLVEQAREHEIKIIGLSRSNIEEDYVSEKCDLETCANLNFLDKHQLKGIIHLAANSNVNACEENPAITSKINVDASILLAQYAKSKNIPFVFSSSDQVFDGAKGNYTPSDEAKPLNEYGTQKLKAEKEILSTYPRAVICRLPLMIGEKGGYEKAFIQNLQDGKKQTLFMDEIRSVEHASVIATKLIDGLAWEGGLYHLPGPTNMNRYELGVMLAQKHGLNEKLLSKGKQSDVQMMAERPKNATMVC